MHIPRIGIGGIGGRMGREIVAAAEGSFQVVGGVERPEIVPNLQLEWNDGLRLVEEIDALLPDIDLFIDFSTPAGTARHASACAGFNIPFVSGVTGLADDQLAALTAAAARIPVFYARNMSLGISAMLEILPHLIHALDGYDIEIVELHHRHKRDAPSGTALALAEVIAGALDARLDDRATFGRHGIAPRAPGEIGIHALRGGGNVGEHTVLLAQEGEEIRLSHRALSRRTFAVGALRAASFVLTQTPGFFTMSDLVRHTIRLPTM